MTYKANQSTAPNKLEQLLRRGDVWRGQSQRFIQQATRDTGYSTLNDGLMNNGWPLANLVEVCQPIGLNGTEHTGLVSQGEWLLVAPALQQSREGYTVLLNPPAMPFAPGLIQIGIDLDRLIIVETKKKVDFLASFVELARTEICSTLLAWQPTQKLNYTELRKCQLACSDGKGLYLLFRPTSAQQQSSPAALRLRTQIHARTLEIHIFKQKGFLERKPQQSIHLPLPSIWLPLTSHASLGHNSEYSPEKKSVASSDIKKNPS